MRVWLISVFKLVQITISVYLLGQIKRNIFNQILPILGNIWNRLTEELKRAKVLNKTTAKCTNNFSSSFLLLQVAYCRATTMSP